MTRRRDERSDEKEGREGRTKGGTRRKDGNGGWE